MAYRDYSSQQTEHIRQHYSLYYNLRGLSVFHCALPRDPAAHESLDIQNSDPQ